jgi:translocation and assembly module TamB
MAKRLLRVVAWIVVLLGLAVLAVAWRATREETLQWAARQVSEQTAGAVVLEEVHGSLLGPLSIGKVRYESADLRISADGVELRWEPMALLMRPHIAHVTVLSIRMLDVTSLPKTGTDMPAQPPDSLRLPLPVVLDGATIEDLVYTSGDTSIEARQVKLAYEVNAQSHRLSLERAATEFGVLEGRAIVGADPPFDVDGALFFDGRYDTYPFRIRATVAGTLAQMRVAAVNTEPPLAAEVEAVITPFAALPIEHATARADSADLRSVDGGLPTTDLALTLQVRPLAEGRFTGEFRVTNRSAGTLDKDRVPLVAASGRFEGEPTDLALGDLAVDLGPGGRFTGDGGVRNGRVHFDLETPGLNLKGLYGKLQETKLAGALELKLAEDAQTLTVDLSQQGDRIEGEAVRRGDEVEVRSARVRAKGGELTLKGQVALAGKQPFSAEGTVSRFDPSAFGDFPKAQLNGSFRASGSLSPQWAASVAVVVADSSRFRGARLAGNVKLGVAADRIDNTNIALQLGANRLDGTGSFGTEGDRLVWNILVTEPAVLDPQLGGRLTAEGVLEGTPARPAGSFTVDGKGLRWGSELTVGEVHGRGRISRGLEGDIDLTVQAQQLKSGTRRLDRASVAATGTLDRHEIRLAAAGPALDASVLAVGGWSAPAGWSGRVVTLENAGEFPLRLVDPTTVEIASNRFVLGPANVRFGDGTLSIDSVRRSDGTLETRGEFTAVPAALLLKLGQSPEAFETTLTFGGRWNIRADQHLNGSVEIARESGDVLLGAQPATALGLERLSVAVRSVDDQLTAVLDAAGGNIGTLAAEGATVVTHREGAWGIAGTAPLKLTARGNMPSLAWLQAFTGDAVTLGGRVDLVLAADGTVADPGLQGSFTGEELRLGLPEPGVFLDRGTLRGTFEASRLILDELVLRGGDGTLTVKGTYGFGKGDGLELVAAADRLELLTRPDQKLTVSGNIDGSVVEGRLTATGKITTDSARIEVLPQTAPTLSSDVVVKGREAEAERRAAGRSFADIDLELDLGKQFYVKAYGLDGRLAGSIRLRARDRELPTATGTIRVVQGTYEAFGQRLSVERAIITFSGPIDDPGVNALALRKNQSVEAGVAVTGTVRSPTVKLVSIPDVPDTEKLSWLMLGRAPDPTARDNDVLAAATASLLAAGGTSLLGIGNKGLGLGLDSVGMRSDERTAEQLVSVGKRLSDKVYVTYERSVSGAVNVTKVRYILSRRWSVEAATGSTNAIDVFFTLFFN